MNIPNVISELGKGGDDSIYAKVGKTVNIKESDRKKELYNIMMDLNLDERKITFDLIPYHEKSAKEFNYFGNNSAANIQIYAVRDVNSISNFWLGKRSGIFKNLLDHLSIGELYFLLKECFDAGFFSDDGINTKLFVFHDGTSGIKVDCIVEKNKKKFIIGNEKYNAENLLKHIRGLSSKCKVILVIPRIIKNKQRIVISTHKDYIDLVLQSIESANSDELSEGVCHICQSMKKDINTIAYSSKLSRSSVNKIFVTTTINYASAFNKNNYNSNYAICQQCYSNLIMGENVVVNRFGGVRIAGEKVIFLFEGIFKKIDYTYIEDIKSGIDLIFNAGTSEAWHKKLLFELHKEQKVFLFQFSMIFHQN
jgi:CRISPR-associated protein Csh1